MDSTKENQNTVENTASENQPAEVGVKGAEVRAEYANGANRPGPNGNRPVNGGRPNGQRPNVNRPANGGQRPAGYRPANGGQRPAGYKPANGQRPAGYKPANGGQRPAGGRNGQNGNRTFSTREQVTRITRDGAVNPNQRGGQRSAQNGRSAQNVKQSNPKLKRNVIIAAVSAVVLVVLVMVIRSACMLSKPKAKVENVANGLKISWEAVKDAESYEILKESNGEWVTLKTVKKTVYTDTKVKNGESYKYKVRAASENKHSDYKKLSSEYLASITIKNVVITEGSISFEWKGYDTAKEYYVYKRVSNGELKKVETYSSDIHSYSDEDVEKDVVYSYAVVQKSSHGEGPMPKEEKAISVNTKLKSASAKNSPNGVTVSWKGNIDITSGYEVYRKVKGGKWELAGTADKDATSFIDKNAPGGKDITYKVKVMFGDNIAGDEVETKSVYAIDPNKKLICLTYDDGPYGPVTNTLLDLMEKYNTHCTFFVTGRRVASYSDCLKRAVSLGCEIGSHTYDHTYLSLVERDVAQKALDDGRAEIEKVIGDFTLLRPPGGYEIDNIEYPEIMWSIDTKDWSNRNASITLSNAKSQAFDGGIILMHDLYASSAEASKSLIPYLLENNYQLVTVSELFEARGIKLENGKVYYSAKRQTAQ